MKIFKLRKLYKLTQTNLVVPSSDNLIQDRLERIKEQQLLHFQNGNFSEKNFNFVTQKKRQRFFREHCVSSDGDD